MSETPDRPRSSRDPALDVLRGWAIVLMSLSHIGSRTVLCTVAHLPVWISAADPFVVLSGVVLGMRIPRAGAAGLVDRAVRFYFIHVTLMTVVVLVHESTGRLNVPWVRDIGGWQAALWMIPTLRLQSADYMNILPLFIVFFALGPVLVGALERGLSALVLAVSVALSVVAQVNPEFLRFTDVASGPQIFVLFGWQLAFVLGLLGGYHSSYLARSFWPRARAWLLPTIIVVMGALFLLATLQRHAFARFGLPIPRWLPEAFSKETWGPGRVVYDLGLMLLAYLGLRRLRQDADGFPRWAARVLGPLEFLGKNSLYCFLVHLPLALLASATHLDAWPRLAQLFGAVAAIAVVYQMAKHQVLKQYIPS